MVDRRVAIITAVAAAIGIGLGVIIGYFSRGETYAPVPPPRPDPDANDRIMKEISNKEIENNLRILTENPHIAGRSVDEEDLVGFVRQRFSEAGLEVETYPYDVLLSYPDDDDPNFVAIKQSDGSLVEESQPKEAILDESQDKPGVVNPFNAYSKSGDPEGDIVYVNYGTIEDFIEIDEKINLTGKICITRYGSIFRGDKAAHAEQYGCAGLIIYSDPADYILPGVPVYPNDWSLPGTGVQRGTLYQDQGDPLTLLYPSLDTAWRVKEEDALLPGIPVTPIGYDDAIKYLSRMAGDEVPAKWRGNLDITYRYGPGFADEHSESTMRMHVTTRNQRETTHNVIGYLRGSVEPDRYVLIGNHRDAWVFGAMDPSSGTATMLEIVRSIGEAVKSGWKPRRTIVFCSWGAEEYSLIGSSEWVEEFQKVLGSRSVAYINTDTTVAGDHLIVRGSNSLKNVIYDAVKSVPNPDPNEVDAGRTDAFSTWVYQNDGNEPSISTLGSGSDYTMFLQLVGIACLDLSYKVDPDIGLGYPVYHSVYETFDLVKAFVDPDFTYHQASARIAAEMARNLADSPLLPFDVREYVQKMTADMESMLDVFGDSMTNNGNIDTNELVIAMSHLSEVAASFHDRLENIDLTDSLALRGANDQLMFFERAFIDKLGIEGRSQYSHVIYAPSQHNAYGGSAFPGLVDSMFRIGDQDDPQWENVRRQFSILLYHIGSAASTLEDVTPILGYSNRR